MDETTTGRVLTPRVHDIKVVPPYFDALVDHSKRFEVRKNDRGYQAGDSLILREFDASKCAYGGHKCKSGDPRCPSWGRVLYAEIGYVYAGDPRFGGIEPGHVVLSLLNVRDTEVRR